MPNTYHNLTIVTLNERPPISRRLADWVAYVDEWGTDDIYGYGATEAEAVEMLIERLDDITTLDSQGRIILL